MTATKLVLLTSVATDLDALLRPKLTMPFEIAGLPDDAAPDAIAAALREAEVVLTPRFSRALPPAPRLRFLQVAAAGWDGIEFGALPPGVTVSNAYGHEPAIAEYVIMGMLMTTHRVVEAEQTFRAGSWRMGPRLKAPVHDEIGGKTVGILGVGRIGRTVARLARAFGMRVIGCNRTVRDEADIERVYPLSELHGFLARCDFVANCAGLAPETKGLIGAGEFAAMRPSAVLINVGRGETVDEDALYDALAARRIGGAVIDTWYRYPTPDAPEIRPSRHPFHELPNLVMTPHCSAWTHGLLERRLTEIAANLDRFARGEPVQNIIHRTPG